MNRIAIKVTGAQGQGVNVVGEVLSKALKRMGYCVFMYREYMSLIKGGHSSAQIDVSAEPIASSQAGVDILACFNHHGLEQNLGDVKQNGIVLHQSADWKWTSEQKRLIKKMNMTVVLLPVEETLAELKAKPILGNMLLTAATWALLGCDPERLKELAREQFGKKGEAVVAQNLACIDCGVRVAQQNANGASIKLPRADAQWSEQLLLTGSQAMGFGLIHGGCRMYVGYPMTPSSPLLTFMADMQNEAGLVIKQAEDEITAAQMMSGAMLMGTRAATGTSGGGFDLMTETVSLNGIIENPSLFVLAQRPGPATGLPTWTGQGDLLLAVGSSHGEFSRVVLSVSDSDDAFHLMPQAFNLAEQYQTPVIVMTDKQIAEALYTQAPYDENHTVLQRGKLITDPEVLKTLKGTDRYDSSSPDGVSARWLPGADAATFCSQGDEHSADGTVDETAANSDAQQAKRMRKLQTIRDALPQPQLYSVNDGEQLDLLIVGWGSTKGPVLDALRSLQNSEKTKHLKIGYLHYTYLWPLKTEFLEMLSKKSRRTLLIEGNRLGQLGMLIRMQCGLDIKRKLLKYDGRPFFVNEIEDFLHAVLLGKKVIKKHPTVHYSLFSKS